MKILHFPQHFPNFFFGFSFYAIPQKCRLQQSLTLKDPAHDPGPWRLYEGLQGRSLLLSLMFFVMIPVNEKVSQKWGFRV